MEKKFDAVVIGAGNGGLIAATTLAKNNRKVLLLEKGKLPGGFATSFVRGRFEFEPSLHELCDLGNKTNPGFVYKLFQELEIKVDWKPVPEAFRLITKMNDFRYDLTFPFGLNEFAQRCEKYVPNSYDSVIKFLKICKELKNAISYLEEVKGKPNTKFLKKHFPNYLTTAPYTLKEVLQQLKVPLLTQNFIETYWSYLGVPSSQVSFHIYAIMFYEYIAFGAYIPANRSHEISQSILTRFQALGGEVWFNTPAQEILVENNRVVAVKTAHGLIKTNYVISNVSPHIVYGQMMDPKDIPEHDKKMVNSRKPGVQGFSVYLGLDISVEKLGLDCYSYFISKDLVSDKQFSRMKTLSNTEDYIVVALNNANQQASEPGTCILSFTTLFIDAWKNVTEKEYFKLKNDIANKMIRHFENLLNVNIKEHIEEIEIATPITFARYTGSINGAIYGYDVTPFDSTFARSVSMDKDCGISGLRFCGGNAYRGHGFSTTYLSGKTIAMKTYQEMMKDPEVIAELELRAKALEEKMVEDQRVRALKHKALTEKQLAENERQRLLLIKNEEESRLKAAADKAKMLAEIEKEKLLIKETNKINEKRIEEIQNKENIIDTTAEAITEFSRRKLRFIEKQTRLLERAVLDGDISRVEANRIIESYKSRPEPEQDNANALVVQKSQTTPTTVAQFDDNIDHAQSKVIRYQQKQEKKLERQLASLERLKKYRLSVESPEAVQIATIEDAQNALVVQKRPSQTEQQQLQQHRLTKLERLNLKHAARIAKIKIREENRINLEEQKAALHGDVLTAEQTELLAQKQKQWAEKLEAKIARSEAKHAAKVARFKMIEERQTANLKQLAERCAEIENSITNAHKVDINAAAVKVALELAKVAEQNKASGKAGETSSELVVRVKQLNPETEYTKEELLAKKLSLKQEQLLQKQQQKEARKQSKYDKKQAAILSKELARQKRNIILLAGDTFAKKKLSDPNTVIEVTKDELHSEIRSIKMERRLAKELAKQEKAQLRAERRNALSVQHSDDTSIPTNTPAFDAAAPVASKSFFGKRFTHQEKIDDLDANLIDDINVDQMQTQVSAHQLSKQERKAEKIRIKQERLLAKQLAKQERIMIEESQQDNPFDPSGHVVDFKKNKPLTYSGMDQATATTVADEIQQMLAPVKAVVGRDISTIASPLSKFTRVRRFGKERNVYEFSDMIEYKIDKYLRKTYARHSKLLTLEQIEAKKIASVEMLRDSLITNKRLLKLAILAEGQQLAEAEQAEAQSSAASSKTPTAKPKISKTTKTKSAKSAKTTKTKPKKVKSVKVEKPEAIVEPVKTPKPKVKKLKKTKPAKTVKPKVVVAAVKTKKITKQKPAKVAKQKATPKVNQVVADVKKPIISTKKPKLMVYKYERAKIVESKINSLNKKQKPQKMSKVKTIKQPKPLPEPVVQKKVNRR